jgi:RNA polymerase sigma-70 factor (ECF subfamily)
MTFAELYKERQTRLLRFVQRILHSRAEAEEVSQEAFLRAYAAEVGGQTEYSAALLYTVARNLALSELRKRTTRAADAFDDSDPLGQLHNCNEPEAQAIDKQTIRAVEQAMLKMPPKCLEVFQLRKLEDLSHAQISLQLGISVKTVERHLTKALRLCRESALGDTTRTSSPGEAETEDSNG